MCEAIRSGAGSRHLRKLPGSEPTKTYQSRSKWPNRHRRFEELEIMTDARGIAHAYND
jgi:hypothetical protein